MFENVINKIKNMFKKKKRYGMPQEYLFVRWKKETEKYEVFGDQGKEIIWIKNNKGYRAFPYSENLLKNLKGSLNLPIFDQTEGRSEPDVDLADVIDPGKVEVRGL